MIRECKNTIAVSEAFDRLEAENKQLKADVNNVLMQNQELCRALQAMYSVEEYMKLQNENAELKQKLHDAEMRSDLAEAAETERKIDYKELKERHRWRKVSEEMPEDGAEVLASDGEEIWLCYKETMCDGSPWFQPEGLPHIEGITHWMPLPEQPKEADK